MVKIGCNYLNKQFLNKIFEIELFIKFKVETASVKSLNEIPDYLDHRIFYTADK